MNIFNFWEGLIDEIFNDNTTDFSSMREKAVNLFRKKPYPMLKMQEDMICDAGATAGKLSRKH